MFAAMDSLPAMIVSLAIIVVVARLGGHLAAAAVVVRIRQNCALPMRYQQTCRQYCDASAHRRGVPKILPFPASLRPSVEKWVRRTPSNQTGM
jgi:hypothetical protein